MVFAAGAPAQTSELVKPRSSLVIALDSSQAMGRTRLAAARSAIVRAVRTLPAGTPVGLRPSSGGAGTSWAVLAALCAGGALLGGGGGLVLRRR
jgi:LPXTG-motif cell wall-anchored protein